MHLVMIDNYDSFTYNLVQLFRVAGVTVDIIRNDEVDINLIRDEQPDLICISPGPGRPAEAGASPGVVRTFSREVPMLGVCLGMQVINEVFGGRTTRAPRPEHGKRWPVYHDGRGILAGLPSPFAAARYHSLCCTELPPTLEPLASTRDGVVMAFQHRELPICGVQFHPESFMTEHGSAMISNFLAMSRSPFQHRIASAGNHVG